MKTPSRFVRAALAAAALLLIAAVAPAQDETPAKKIELKSTDSAGKPVRVPLASKSTMLLFVRIDQPQSVEAFKDAQQAAKDAPKVQVIVIVSGKDIPDGALKKFIGESPWPVVRDEDYSILGELRVRVWPTTFVVMPDGTQVVRLTGMPTSYASDLSNYLAFAEGKITAETLKKRLGQNGVVADSTQQMAARHLLVSRRLLEKGLVDQAWKEISEALKLEPKAPHLQQAMARVLLMMNKPVDAMGVLDKLEMTKAPDGETKTLRGRAMVALKQWDDAKAALEAAVKLNPNPAEAYYFLGQVYQQQGKWQQAAEAYRKAFEATDAGRLVIPPGTTAQPTTQPAGKSSAPAKSTE